MTAIPQELVKKDLESTPETVQLGDAKYLQKHVDKMPDIGKKFEYLLNTGNLVSKSGLDLSQATGFTVRKNVFVSLVCMKSDKFYVCNRFLQSSHARHVAGSSAMHVETLSIAWKLHDKGDCQRICVL